MEADSGTGMGRHEEERREGATLRAHAWAATMAGWADGEGLVHAHASAGVAIATGVDFDRPAREAAQELLNPAATRAEGGGERGRPEPGDPHRTCFEKDRDRIVHSPAFRRLAGKTQVFVFPRDHQRTRLTHALEVAQVARSIAKRLRLNEELTEAIALGHDCGHGPGGHASEDALAIFMPGGYDHATIGADRVLSRLNLCAQTLDGVRNHSWSRPTPGTPEGMVVSWADRIAYCAHDLEDAASAGVVDTDDLPGVVREAAGTSRSGQLDFFINALVSSAMETGMVAMRESDAEVLGALRSFNYERIYLRPESRRQSEQVIKVLRLLVEHLSSNPEHARHLIGFEPGISAEDLLAEVVIYVGGMTDRYAFETARELIGLDPSAIPQGIA